MGNRRHWLRFPGSPSGLAELPLLPFGLILGLASAGLALGGFRGSAGPHTWLAAFACAVTPMVFYVSSRYGLPFAFLLAVPAGVGASALFSRAAPGRARARAGALAAGCAALSFLVPFPELRRAEEAAALAHRAIASRLAGDPAGAEREARRAVAADPESAPARFALALTLERSGRGAEAEAMYRTLLELEPGHAEAAGNLAGLLTDAKNHSEYFDDVPDPVRVFLTLVCFHCPSPIHA